MRTPFAVFPLFTALLCLQCCTTKSQESRPSYPATTSKIIGGGCDGCEIMYAGIPKYLNAVDTSVGWQKTPFPLIVKGTVYQLDGRTPAADVIVYYWQTDDKGYYSQRADEPKTRHGARRGWLKTGPDGRYTLFTNRPAAYPQRNIPAHIHLAIKEPALPNEYYVDELVFDDDPLLTTSRRKALENRGGSGVLRPSVENGVEVAEHDIILGLHIPDYPVQKNQKEQRGLSIGEESPSFTPQHAWGDDRGSTACPVCKYGRNYGVLYFAGKTDPPENQKKWLVYLENTSQEKGDLLKVYFICEAGEDAEQTSQWLQRLGRELSIRRLALTYVPSWVDTASDVYLNRLDPARSNTFIVYKNRVIIDTYQDLLPTPENFQKITQKVP